MHLNECVVLLVFFSTNCVFAQVGMEEFHNPKQSVKLFNSSVSRSDSINDIQIPFLDHLYFLKESPCYKYIFRPNNEVEYENHCPVCYTSVGLIGSFKYLSNDLIEVSSEPISIYSAFVDRIESNEQDNTELSFEILDENLNHLGKVLTIYYNRRPAIFHKTGSLTLKRDDINKLVGKNIILERLSFETFVNNKREIFYVPVNWKVKLEANTYNIILRKNGYRIKLEKNACFLYGWRHQNQEYRKIGELIYKMD